MNDLSDRRRTGAIFTALAVSYFSASALALALTRFEGGPASVWVADAVLFAALATRRIRDWPPVIAVCAAGAVASSGIWGLGWAWSPVMSGANLIEPMIAVMLLRRLRVEGTGFDGGRELTAFALVAGVVAPLLTGLPAAIALTMTTSVPFVTNLMGWTTAHGLGAVVFSPCLLQFVSGETRRSASIGGGWRKIEVAATFSLTAAVAVAVFNQSSLPLLFLPTLPLMVATFRVGRVGAAGGVAIMAVVGLVATALGHGPATLVHGGIAAHLRFLQLYLAATVLTVLPVAAVLAGRRRLYDMMRDDQAKLRLLLEGSSDAVIHVGIDGIVRYASPSVEAMGFASVASFVGRSAIEFVAAEDRTALADAHRRVLRSPGETVGFEFRGVASGDEARWFESRSRAVHHDASGVTGVVSVIRETTERRRHEQALSLAAATDSLTGLRNRRAFDLELDRLAANGKGGCVAIFDLDRFKAVNDAHGHAGGDEVLRTFAKRAATGIRDGDILARVGGEEFAILFAGIGPVVAEEVCERIRREVAAEPVLLGEWPVRITVSIGVATMRIGDPPASCLERADRALYDAKREGRNRLRLAA